jgi:streptogramin lyase
MLKKTQPPHKARILRFFAMWFFCFSLPASANSGLNWLASQTHTGGISTPDDVAITFQATAEALRTIHAFGEDTTFSSIVEFGQQILNTENEPSTENLSRRLIATAEPGNNVSVLINDLLALQNPDGGFGQRAGFDSTVLNTAFALEALAIAKASEKERIEQAITFLTNHQNLDGSFRLNSANENALYVTSLATIALQRFLFQAQITDNVDKANQYLLLKISQDQIASDWELALTLLSVASATADNSLYKTAAATLRSHQNPNGSWDNDVYITALALRALHHVRRIQFPVDPNKGIFTGRVLDDNTGLPLAKVTVLLETVDSVQTLTESDGTYGLASLDPGTYTLKYQLAGYNTASLPSVSLIAGQFADLGTLRLMPLPDVGIITGIITDMNTNQPLSNAQVAISGAVTTSVLTEDDGHYTIVSPPGSITITVSKIDYDSIGGTGTVNRGATLKFSPALNPTGTTPQNPEVTVKGILKDGETGAPLNNALITVVGTDYQGHSDDTGAFSIPGVAPGELTIEMSLNGYQVGRFTVLAPPGAVVDLDTTHLPKTVPVPTTTLIGQVRHANTGDPIEGANVTLETLNRGALTDKEGSYRIEDIDILEFKVSANAVNYLPTNYTLSVNQAGLVTVDFNLTPAAESPLEISALSLEQSNYDALSAVHINAVLNNKENTAQPVRLSIKVVNEDQQIVEQFTPIINSLVTVEPNNPLSTQVEWQTARHLPGHYELIVQAFDGNSGQLLAEQGTQISVEPTSRIGGHVAFEPPIAQLAAKKPVQITAKVANQGNQPLEGTTLTATLSLKNPGYQQHKHEVLVESFVEEHELMNNPRGIAQDAAGNFYVANYNNHSVLKITPEGTVSEFATDLNLPIDVDLDHLGNLYVLSYNSNRDKGLVRLGTDGSRTEVKLSVSNSQAIEVLDDGRILIAAGNTLYAVTLEDNNTQANVTTLVAGGLNGPRNLIADSQGNLFITDFTSNAVVKFSDNELAIFAEIKQPSGITIDANDNLYVTSFSDNSLLKITPDGQQSIIATGLSGPYDVKIAPEGNAIAPEGHFVVSNQHSHEIVTITPTGDISTLVQPIFYGPRALAYDAEGHLYIGNQHRKNIIKLATDGVVTELSSTYNPRDILALDNDIYWLEYNSLSTIGPNDSAKTTLTSKLIGPYALINAPDGNGFFVSEFSVHRISRVSTTGEITPYTTLPSFISPRSIRRDAQGHLYLLSDNGYIIQFTETGQIIRVISDLKSPTSLAIDSDGNLIVPEDHNKRILRIAPNGNRDEIANQLKFSPYACAINSQGDIIVAPRNEDTLHVIENGKASEYAKLNEGTTGYDMLFDASDNLWISQYQQHKVLKLSADLTEQKIYSLINNRRFPQSLFLDGTGGILVGGYQFIQRIDNQG